MERHARWLRLLVTLVILGLVLREVEPQALLDRVRAVPWWTLGVPCVLLLVNAGIHAVRLRLLLGAPPWSEVLRAVLFGNFMGLVLPTGGGEAAKGFALAPLAGGLDRAFAALVTSRLLELAPWGLLLVWGACGVLPGRLPVAVLPTAIAAATMLLVSGVALGVVLRPTRVLGWIPWAPLRARLLRVAALGSSPTRILASGLWAVPFALLNCLSSWTILRGYGVAIGYDEVMGLVPALDVLISLPISVSGVGVREAVYVGGLSAWGVDPATATAAAATRWGAEVVRSLVGGGWWLLAGRDTSPSRDGRGEGDYPPEDLHA